MCVTCKWLPIRTHTCSILRPRDQLVGIQTIITQLMQLHFLQNLPHHLVTTIHLLNICTVEVVDTSQHLAHFNFSKVLLIVIILSLYGCPVSNLLVIFLGLLLHHDSYKSIKPNYLSPSGRVREGLADVISMHRSCWLIRSYCSSLFWDNSTTLASVFKTNTGGVLGLRLWTMNTNNLYTMIHISLSSQTISHFWRVRDGLAW